MAVLQGILKDSWAHYRNLEVKINKRLKALPAGSVFARSIGKQKYYYLSIRKNSQSLSRYLGKRRPKELDEAKGDRGRCFHSSFCKRLPRSCQQIRKKGSSVPESPLRARCDERFRGAMLTVQLSKVSLLPTGDILLFTNFGDSSLTFSCSLSGTKYKDQVAKLSMGEVIKIRGRLKEHSLYGGGGSRSEFLSLDPCDIAD